MKQTNEAADTAKRVLKAGESSSMKVRKIAFIGLMGAVSAVLMIFRFPIPFMPPFLSFDFSGLMELIGGFMFGPAAAVMIVLVKITMQVVMQGSFSMGTGELQNFILSCIYVLPSVLIYYKKKTRGKAVTGMAIGTILVAVAAVFTNLYLIIPFYVRLFGMSMDDIITMCNAVNPAVKDAFSMALLGILPFNLIKYGVTSVLALVLYKRLGRVIKNMIGQ